MFDLNWSYANCIANSEKIAWQLDEVFPEDTSLDFALPFLPEQLALVDDIDFLSTEEKKKFNQISGNTYLHLFGFVEEYILANTVQYANAEMFGDRDAVRALCRFADEEAKHMLLFSRYRKAFNRGFGYDCPVLESAVAVAEVIMQKSPIAVMMLTLHIELMTQQHYTECVKDNKDIDPLFSKLLKCHWLEESQHARIDALELEKLVMAAEPEQIGVAVGDYLRPRGCLRRPAEAAGRDGHQKPGRGLRPPVHRRPSQRAHRISDEVVSQDLHRLRHDQSDVRQNHENHVRGGECEDRREGLGLQLSLEQCMSQQIVWTKLVNFMGPSRARALMGDVLDKLGLAQLENAQDRLRFATELISRGGANSMIGQTIALQARLHGARG